MPSPVRKPKCPPTDRLSAGGCAKGTPGKNAAKGTPIPRTGHMVPANEGGKPGGKGY